MAIREFVDWMSEVNKFPMMSKDDVVGLGDKGLVACTCKDYLHYCFCKHAFLISKSRGIFKGYPPTLDTMPVRQSNRVGRPGMAQMGGALD
jgi:hypothetical protein